ncbi:MAG: precorrin-6A reductase [Clostridia bacterium]|nr:precorrin-6A reductase [Clostridia bacterium]
MTAKPGSNNSIAAVFAGTYEGRMIASHVLESGMENSVDFFVATEYGQEILQNMGKLRVIEGRLDGHGMEKIFEEKCYSLVIDATHPYADQVSDNIRSAAEKTGTEYLRLLRKDVLPSEYEGLEDRVIFAESAEDAVRILGDIPGRVLLTTGSKDLARFSEVPGFRERFTARVLPSVESVRLCAEAGLKQPNIICMQGPFSLEMNLATLRQFGCETLVTKSTGRAGGFSDKLDCAREGFRVLVIRRPGEEEGSCLEDVLDRLDQTLRGGNV